MVLDWDFDWPDWLYDDRIVRHDAEEFQHVTNRACQNINSMSRSELFLYARNVTKDEWRYLENLFYRASTYEHAHRSAPEAIVKTVKSILACIKSRLEGKCF